MPKRIDLIRTFIACPGDVDEERRLVSIVADELNLSVGASRGLRLEIVHWMNSSWPDIGTDPQAVINQQIGEYDIFVGILWKQFGTPTKRAPSGTVEEFEIARRLWDRNRNTRIMVYFNREPFYPSTVEELRSFEKVLAFKNHVSEKGVRFEEYTGHEDFKNKLRHHLTFVLTRETSKSRETPLSKKVKSILAFQENTNSVILSLTEALVENSVASLLYLDIDGFKRFNDKIGSEIIDDVLEKIVATLLGEVGARGRVMRIFGDEFVMMMPDLEIGAAVDFAEHVRIRVETAINMYALSVSFGVVSIDGSQMTAEEAVQQVRRAVHVSKLRGRNRTTVCPLSPEDEQLLRDRDVRGYS